MIQDTLKRPIYLSSTIGFLISVVFASIATLHLSDSEGWRRLLLRIVAFVFFSFAIMNIIVIAYFLKKNIRIPSQK